VTASFFSMQSGHKLSRWCISAVICSVLTVQGFAQGDGQELRKVVATGAGMNEDQALKNAFTIAVQQVVGTIVDTETIVREDDTIREQILSASNGFIKSYKLIRQWQQDGLHQCSIEALVQIQQLKERLAEANISTFAVSGTNLAARVQTETTGQADTPTILAKLINDLPNRVLRVQARGDPVPTSPKQEGVTRLKIPIIVFVDQKAYAQETAQLTTTLDKLALQSVTGNLKLARQSGQVNGPGSTLLLTSSGVQLLSNDVFLACAECGGNDMRPAAEAFSELQRDAKQKFGTLPEAPGVITLMSGLSATGTTRLSLYAMNKTALGSLDAAAPCRIVVTVGLADASGAELDSSENSFEPGTLPQPNLPFVLENFDKGGEYRDERRDPDVWISPGLRTGLLGMGLGISTSWTGDVYADIETEMLPRLKSIKLSVQWSGPSSGKAKASQRTEEHAKEHPELTNAPPPPMTDTPDANRTADARRALPVMTPPPDTPEPTPTPRVPRNEVTEDHPTPVPTSETEIPSADPWEFIVSVEKDLNDHNWRDLASHLVDGHVNYFGHRLATVQYIAHDMESDAVNYPSSRTKYYPDTFTHEISNEYSPHWNGPMIYDSINVYSVITETKGRIHRAMTRLTVGYTVDNGVLGIYALVMKVLPTNF
jgi:hypothetical protein